MWGAVMCVAFREWAGASWVSEDVLAHSRNEAAYVRHEDEARAINRTP